MNNIVFFGDAISDLLAAQAARVAFVGVINERDNFADQCDGKVGDFVTLAQVESCRQQALQALQSTASFLQVP